MPIYSIDMSFNFLLQATRILHVGNQDEDELIMIYNYLIALDNEILNDYYNTCTILSYDNDLILYMEILDTAIEIFEEREEYEKCQLLKNKKEESINITKNKTIQTMSIFNMSDAEKKKILEKHQEATKNQYLKKEETKKGLQKPEEKKDKKTS